MIIYFSRMNYSALFFIFILILSILSIPLITIICNPSTITSWPLHNYLMILAISLQALFLMQVLQTSHSSSSVRLLLSCILFIIRAYSVLVSGHWTEEEQPNTQDSQSDQSERVSRIGVFAMVLFILMAYLMSNISSNCVHFCQWCKVVAELFRLWLQTPDWLQLRLWLWVKYKT